MVPNSEVPLCFASCSIRLARHTFHQKVKAISHAGFTTIKLSIPDLISYARLHFGRDIAEDNYNALSKAGKHANDLYRRLN